MFTVKFQLGLNQSLKWDNNSASKKKAHKRFQFDYHHY